MVFSYKGIDPQIDESAFIAENATVIGMVSIGKNSSIWFNAVLRGDIDRIRIGQNTNIQDGSVLHCSTGFETFVGNNVTVGHNCILHSCHIDDGSLIGMGAVVIDGVRIGKNCLIGAGSVIAPNKIILDNSLVYGNPARVIRTLSENEIEKIHKGAEHYMELMDNY